MARGVRTNRCSRPIDPNSATLHRLSSIELVNASLLRRCFGTRALSPISLIHGLPALSPALFSLSLSSQLPPAPLPLAPALVSRQFLSLPFHPSNEDFRRMAKTPLPSPGGRILRFKSLESRLKTSHPNFPPTFHPRFFPKFPCARRQAEPV